jgi:hypothetical protein
MELQIFQQLNYQIILVSTYEFIKSYIFDFHHNWEQHIKTNNLTHHINNMESAAVYLGKIMLHDETFCSFK